MHNIKAISDSSFSTSGSCPTDTTKIQCRERLSFGVLVPGLQADLHDFQSFRLLSNALRRASAQVLHQ